ncbi:MAG: hypothetical protein KF896_15875 [Ignavibacteriae bacterium]|nr:hypothetical protein [Ignavibacteriota bacterium]MBX3045191.1 hypothetical protein [Ignavibacteriota bacterium]
MITIEILKRISEIVNIEALTKKSGLNSNTIRQKINRGTELNIKESIGLTKTLKEYCNLINQPD